MKIQTLAPLLVACLALTHAAHAQVPQTEQKTAFCATSVELARKRDTNEMYLCETSKYTCAPYLKPSCLDDAKQGGWEVLSSKQQTLLKDYANTPCKCVGTQYELERKLAAAAPAVVSGGPAAATTAPAVAAALPVAAPLAANAPAGSLASEVAALKQDNLQIRRQLEQLQQQFDELRRSLPGAK